MCQRELKQGPRWAWRRRHGLETGPLKTACSWVRAYCCIIICRSALYESRSGVLDSVEWFQAAG